MSPPPAPQAAQAHHLEAAAREVARRLGHPPENAVILGSGLGPLAEELAGRVAMPVSEIPGHPLPRVEGHAGRWVKGLLGGVPVLALQGRSHFYEGYDMEQVTFATVLLQRLGVRRLIVTNASGAASPRVRPGDLMLITGAINFQLHQPRWSPAARRGMPLDLRLMAVAERVAAERGIPLRRGALLASCGPSYETPSEVRLIARFGADAACMSTVPEILAAGQVGLRVLGISCITNFGSGLSDRPLNHEEVMVTADRVAGRFRALVEGVLEVFHRENP
ncbi:MAG TPA: purine-nucleoside phosphorylase [Candidatus Saccharimonadales bacterium]|nr:purine-nucleoside phosphorylase [Candidatus Saccharimonadales bacterium]